MTARTEIEKRIVRRWVAKGEAKVVATQHETYISAKGRLISYEAWIVEAV